MQLQLQRAIVVCLTVFVAEVPAVQHASGTFPLHGLRGLPHLTKTAMSPLTAPVPAKAEPAPTRIGRWKISFPATSFALFGITCLVVLTPLLFMLCCLLNGGAHYFKQSKFTSCQRKVQNLHNSLGLGCDTPVCPCCVEVVSSTASQSSKIMFHCGHCFHMNCVNKWFRDHPGSATICPVCMSAPEVEEEIDPETPDDHSRNEERSFILGNLHKRYPAIITEEVVQRWKVCHTEIWLKEMNEACFAGNPASQKQVVL